MKARYRRSKRIGSSNRNRHLQTGDAHVYSVARKNQEQTCEWSAIDEKKLIVAQVERSHFENCVEKPVTSWPLYTSIRATVGRQRHVRFFIWQRGQTPKKEKASGRVSNKLAAALN
jgi:hypothetical protein